LDKDAGPLPGGAANVVYCLLVSTKAASGTVEQGLAEFGEPGRAAVNASREANGHATMRFTTRSSVTP